MFSKLTIIHAGNLNNIDGLVYTDYYSYIGLVDDFLRVDEVFNVLNFQFSRIFCNVTMTICKFIFLFYHRPSGAKSRTIFLTLLYRILLASFRKKKLILYHPSLHIDLYRTHSRVDVFDMNSYV